MSPPPALPVDGPPPTIGAAPPGPTSDPAGVRSGRGCVGCAVSGGFGCLAFLVGATLAVAFFAPQLLGGWAARGVTSALQGKIDGSLVVADTVLSWGDDQRLRDVALRAPDGHLVARGTLRVPSLSQWIADEEAALWRFRGRLAEAALSIDEDGVLDLARILRLDPGRSLGERGALPASLWAALRDVATGDAPPFLIELDAARLTVTDERRGGVTTEFRDVHLELGRPAPDEPARLRLSGEVGQVGRAGSCTLSLELHAPEAARPGEVALRLTAKALPPEAVDLLLGDSRASSLAGGPLELDVGLLGDVQSGATFDLSASSPAGEARARGAMDSGTLRIGAADAAAFEWLVPGWIPEELFAPLVPAPFSVVAEESEALGERARVRLDTLIVDTGWGAGWAPTGLGRLASFEVVGTALVPVTLALGGGGPGVDPYFVRRPLVTARLLGDLGGALVLTWREGEAAVPGSATLRLPSLASLGADGPNGTSPGIGATRATLDLDLPAFPVALLASAASIPEDGVRLMGTEVRLMLGGLPVSGGPHTGPVDVALYVEGARRPIRGRYADGVVRAAGGPQVLSLPGDRARLEAALLPLLPWLEELHPLGDGRLEIAFDELEVPLDGVDGPGLLARGAVELRVPAALARLRAPIARRLGLEEDADPAAWFPSVIRLAMEDEIVRYSQVGVPVGDEECPFRGSFDRKPGERRLDLEGDVPASLVSGELALAPEQLEVLLGTGRRVRVNLSGTVEEPSLFVDTDSMREVLRIDFERALPLLRELLDRGR